MIALTLLELQHKTPIREWHFEGESIIRIGRAVDNHIVLTDNLVSRHHLEIRQVRNPNGIISWGLISQGINGTYLNGILVTPKQLRNIGNNSELQLAQGGPLLKVEINQINTGKQVANTTINSCTHKGNSPGNLFCIHCGQPLNVQQKIRHYQVLRTLGQGGMGTTYLAWDERGKVAPHPQLLVLKQMNTDMAKISKAQELFEREANTLRSLNHPGIPKYYDFFVEAGKKYLAMELVHGKDLEKLIYQNGPVLPKQAITWMIQTCNILDYLHSHQPPLIHRDIKPTNLMVRNADNRIVVLDFGAVKEIGTIPGTRIGAEGYCAPEQGRGQPLTQSDLYAVGPTLIFLLSGENPFKFYRRRGGGHRFRFDLSSVPTFTDQLKKVIERVTEPIPRDRYKTAKELADALATCF